MPITSSLADWGRPKAPPNAKPRKAMANPGTPPPSVVRIEAVPSSTCTSAEDGSWLSDAHDRIGEFWSYPKTRTFAELLIDCEEDWTFRAVLVGMLPEAAGGACRDESGGRSLDLTQARPDRPVSCLTAHLREGAPGCSRRCWDMPQEPSS